MNHVGIVIVTFNSEETIGECLRAARRQPADIVVVDNASQDGTLAVVRRETIARLIPNSVNRGFAGGNNQGVAAMTNELVLLLNPDVVLETGLEELIRAFDEPEVAAAAGMLRGKDGLPQRGFTVRRFPTPAALAFETLGINRLWPGNPVNTRYRCLDLDLRQPADVEQPAGAFLMIRRRTWLELGGMNEGFHPIWFEDVDFLWRLHSNGYRIRYVPSVTAVHQGGHSIQTLPFGCRQQYWYGSLLKYASVHFGPAGRRLVCVTVVFGSLLRMLVSAVRERGPKPIVAYGKVVRLATALFLTSRNGGAGGFAAAGTTS